VTAKYDPLGGELSIEAKIDETGIKASAKSRALAAFDCLCGSVIDIPGAYAEGVARRIRARNEVRQALIEVEGEAAKEKLLAEPTAGDRVIDVFLLEQRRKQGNRDAVASEALATLKALPPPRQDDFAHEGEEDGKPIEEDWLNVFAAHADNASSEHLRQLWGRILAGEIRKPGSFSLTTLRAIAELDRDIALDFNKQLRRDCRSVSCPNRLSLKATP
jgi:hypothetical protein